MRRAALRQPSLRVQGISDGREGVQWNAWHSPPHEEVWLGVNLEGKKYDGWPVMRLIERELSHPLLLTIEVARPEVVRVSWRRDAWQCGYRLPIAESEIPPTPITLNRLDSDGWTRALTDARECFDLTRGDVRRRQTRVTLPGRQVQRELTPHLQFKIKLNSPSEGELRQARGCLKPIHRFAMKQAADAVQ